MDSPAPKEAIVVEVCVKSEHSLGLKGVCIKSEPSLRDDDEPSYWDTCVKDEPSSPEVADARAVSEAAAAARLYADHVVEDELVSTSTSVQRHRVLCAAPGPKLLVKQEKADSDKIAVTPMSVKHEPKWEAEERNMVQPKWETEMMAASHGEPKNEAEGNMPDCHGGLTVFNEEVKQELLKCEADDCKLNEPQNRIPAPNPRRNGPMVFKRIWLPDSDFDDAVIGSTPPTDSTESPVKRVVADGSVLSPVERILAGSSATVTATSQPLVTAIRESRCRKMLEMFPEISPSCIKNTLVKHGWNEKRSRDELRSMTRKPKTRLRHRPRAKARALPSPDKDPDPQYGRKEAAGGASARARDARSAAAAGTTTT